MTVSRRHIPYLSYHKTIIREICKPQQDDLLIIAKGLGLRRIVCALLKLFDRQEDLVIVVNATPSDEAGIGDELGIMGVRDPGFRILTHEMLPGQRADLYRHGGLFSITSKILVNDFLQENVPAKLITGLVILHADRVSFGSNEEFAVRLYRRYNQSGFLKAFSDEPEIFAHGMSPLRDMLINLNMTNAMIWPRFNEAVKVSLASRSAVVIEMYQPMTAMMRQCQDAITECMEIMLVDLKRDHSLNLDLDDINVRNAQFKSFDTIVRMRLKPVWHKVGQKAKTQVAALTELRNLHTWLLEYDSATFASYINTIQRQFRTAQMMPGVNTYNHYWFNANASAKLVEASQARVSVKSSTSEPSPPPRNDNGNGNGASGDVGRRSPSEEDAEELEAMRDVEQNSGNDKDDDEIMNIFATQTQTVHQRPTREEDDEGMDVDDDDDPLREVDESAPPVFRPLSFRESLSKTVKQNLRKGHEAVLEEQPKWSLVSRVLKEIEDTIANVQTSHADQPGTNTVLIMTSSDRTCLQLRQYLTTMSKTTPPFGPQAGRHMMETLFLSNWQHEKNGEKLNNPSRMVNGLGNDEVKSTKKDDIETKRLQDIARRNASKNKRRRDRGGKAGSGGRLSGADDELERKRAMMLAQSAFAGGNPEVDVRVPWGVDQFTHQTPNAKPSTNPPTYQVRTPDPSRVRGITPSARSTSKTLVDLDDSEEERSLSPESPPIAVSPPNPTPRRTNTSPLPSVITDAGISLLANVGVIEEEDLEPKVIDLLRERGIMAEDWNMDYGLLAPEDSVIIRPYGGEDDDILLQELRPRFVVMYEPNLAFIRRLEVYKNCNPGLALRVYQMAYSNSFEEERYLSAITREGEAFKKLIEDKQRMVIPIYNNNPRAPMRDNTTRAKTTYSSRNAGGGDAAAEPARIIVDLREIGAMLPSLIDAAGMKVVPATLTIGDYILSPKTCVERKALPDLEASFGNGRLYTQCDAMTAHYEICILLIEFEEDKYGLRTQADARLEAAGRTAEEWRDTFHLQSKLILLTLHFPRLRIIWSSSPQESVKILSDLKLNFDEPDEKTAIQKGRSEFELSTEDGKGVVKVENAGAVEMLRSIPGVSGHNLKYVMGKVESLKEFVGLSRAEMRGLLGEDNGNRAWEFVRHDERFNRGRFNHW